MPTARHCRVTFAATSTGSVIQVREVAFLDSLGADLSVGGTASASSVNGTDTADKAFDKNTATVWSPAASDMLSRLSYDHGAPVNFSQIRINLAALGSVPALESSIRWATSSDGTDWTLPAPLRLVSGTIAAGAEATYDLVLRADLQVLRLDQELLPFAGSALPSGMPIMSSVDGGAPYRDFEFGGFGRIAGTVKEDGTPTDVPVKRRVRLHREQDGLPVREVWSHPTTGAYSFDYIDATKQYTVITYDYEHDYRAVIADNITPEAMP